MTGYIKNKTYQPLACGCRSVGDGSVTFPLTVELCETHKQAFELARVLKAMTSAADTMMAYAKAGRTVTLWTPKDGISAPWAVANHNGLQEVATAAHSVLKAAGME